MARKIRHEEPENHEAWAIPYGDLVTLLLAFFVVMYAMSSVNAGKYRVLSDSLQEAFDGKPHTATSGDQDKLTLSADPTGHLMKPQEQPDPDANSGDPASSREAMASELGQVADDVDLAMSGLIAAGQVHVHRHEDFVTIDISSDILFSSGVARLAPQAEGILRQLADALRPFPNAVRVAGHTDNRPINTKEFASNWELSTARAASVVHLFMDRGVAPERMAVMGYGEYRPTMPNSSDAARNTNRRVEVTILGRNATLDR